LVQSIAALPDNYITAKRQLREDYNPKVLELNGQILDIKQDISDLKVGLVETGVDVGPAIYLARIFDRDIDTVVKFFIFILIFVFDPLAVMLIVAFNQALVLRAEEKTSRPRLGTPVNPVEKKRWWEVYGERKPLIPKIKILNKLKKISEKARETELLKGGVRSRKDNTIDK
jgi:hypothetical protein